MSDTPVNSIAAAEAVPFGSALAVEVGGFAGPLDLLLHLIQKNRLSIYDIPIASICSQYHEHLASMGELDLEAAGDFLWMAAWLLQLKSRLLLPRPEHGEDPRAELVERLLEYRRVKELAAMLHETDVVRRCLWSPALTAPADPDDDELDWEDVDVLTLARAYLAAMERFAAANPPPLAVLPLRFTVEEKMQDLYRRVVEEGLLPLLRHLHTRSDPEEVVTLVVATLELARLGGIRAEQRRAFAEIYLRPGERELDLSRILAREEEPNGA